jgi:hypothetical protein
VLCHASLSWLLSWLLAGWLAAVKLTFGCSVDG